MPRNVRKAGAIAIWGVASLGLSGTASAIPYGFATNQITDFTIIARDGTATVSSGTESTNTSANLSAGSPTANTDTSALPNGSDAGQAAVGAGPFPPANTFDQFGGDGARADALTASGN